MTMTEVQLLIGDRYRDAAGAATFVRHNPVSGEVATRAAAASTDDAIAAAEAVAEAFPGWSALGPHERRKKMLKAADLLEAKGSGYGRFGGKAAVDEFTELRWITIQTTPRH
jgi:acyl-CoA reductase-like NAD-dependent aldehyde dehydrogenase